MGAIREYYVTTNTDVCLALPALEVTVRAGFFNPMRVLPLSDHKPVAAHDNMLGRDMRGASGKAVPATFLVSKRPVAAKEPVELVKLCPLGSDKVIATEARDRWAGIAFTDVHRSRGLSDHGVVFNSTKEGRLSVGRDADNNVVYAEHELKPKESRQALRAGVARLPLFGLKAGDHVLEILPNKLTPDLAPAGPDTGPLPAAGETQYRPLYLRLTLDGDLTLKKVVTCELDKGLVVDDGPVVMTLTDPDGRVEKLEAWRINHGYVAAHTADELAVDLKPDVYVSYITGKLKRGRPIQMIVIHHTDGEVTGGALNTGVGDKDKSLSKLFGAPYYVDFDGHVYKTSNDEDLVQHVGSGEVCLHPESDTKIEKKAVNSCGVGIETMNRKPAEYTDAVMLSLLRLVAELKDKHDIPRYRIVGHNEHQPITTSSKYDDPGRPMRWPLLEARELSRSVVRADFAAVAPAPDGSIGADAYFGFFTLPAEVSRALFGRNAAALCVKDDDGESRWGAKGWAGRASGEGAKKTVEATITRLAAHFRTQGLVREIQRDLRWLGYPIPATGNYDPHTGIALKRFILHSFSGARRRVAGVPDDVHPSGDRLNRVLAEYLRGSAEAVRKQAREGAAKALVKGAAKGALGRP